MDVAVVTGGGTGLGASIAKRLSSDGFRVAVLSRRAAAHDLDFDCIRVNCDVRDPASVSTAFRQVEREAGTASVIVNSAGMISRAPFLEQEPVRWHEMLETNILGTMHVCKEAAAQMKRADLKGSIVNLSSVAALIALPDRAAYSATKAAIVQFSRCLALELADDLIRVNVVCPGAFATPMTEALLRDPEGRAWYERSIPFGRVGDPAECASVVAFLAGPDSAYVSGSVVSVDGAWNVR